MTNKVFAIPLKLPVLVQFHMGVSIVYEMFPIKALLLKTGNITYLYFILKIKKTVVC